MSQWRLPHGVVTEEHATDGGGDGDKPRISSSFCVFDGVEFIEACLAEVFNVLGGGLLVDVTGDTHCACCSEGSSDKEWAVCY